MNDNTLEFVARINDKQFELDIKKLQSEMDASNKKIQQSIRNEVQGTTSLISTLSKTAAVFFSAEAARRFVSEMVHVRGEFQQLSIAMTTMLGSKQKADELMGQLITTASTTPFGLTDIAQGAKQLLAYGTAANDVNDTLTRLGNIASGLSVSLNDLVYLYGTTQTQGRLFAQDVRQFMGRGIPLVQELAKEMGKTTNQINEMVSAGKIGFPEVQKVIENMTNEGGMFFNLMQEQSKTLTGQLSNLGDAFDVMLNNIGEASQGVISDGIAGVSFLVENYKTVLGILGELVAMYGAYRAALIAYNAIQIQSNALTEIAAIKGSALTAVEKLKVFWIEAETIAQRALNKVLLANPYALITAAVVGLVTAMIAFRDTTTTTEKATEELNKASEERKNQIDEQSKKTNELINTIKNETSTRFGQVQAFKELKAMYPELLKNIDLQGFKTKETTALQKEFNGEMEQVSLDKLQQEYEKAKSSIDSYRKSLEAITSTGQGGNNYTFYAEHLAIATEKAKQLKNQIDEVKQSQFEANATDQEKLDRYNKQLDSLEDQRQELEKSLAIAKNTGNAFLDWKSIIEGISLNKLNAQIGDLLNKIQGVTDGNKSNRTLINEALSLSELEGVRKTIEDSYKEEADAAKRKQLAADLQFADQRKKALDIYGVTKAANTKLIKASEDYASKKTDILKKITDLEHENFKKTLTQNEAEVQSVKDKYAEILKAIKDYNKQAPAGQKIGSGTVTALDISEKKATANVAYQQQTEALKDQLSKQKQIYEEYDSWKQSLGIESANKQFNAELDGFKSYQDYIKGEIIKLMSDASDLKGLTPAMNSRLEMLKTLLNSAQTEYKKADNAILAQTLKDTESVQDKLMLIREKYAEKAKALEKSGDYTGERKKILEDIEQAEIDQLSQSLLDKEKQISSIGDAIAGVTKSQIRSQIESLRSYLESATSLTEGQRKKLQDVINSLSVKMLTATDSPAGQNEMNLPGFNRLQDIDNTIDRLKVQMNSLMSDIGRLGTQIGKDANPEIKLLMVQVEAIRKQIGDLENQKLSALGEAFSDIGGMIEKAANDLGGVDTQLGSILTTIGKITSSGGTLLTGITKTIDALSDISDKKGIGSIFSSAGGGIKGIMAAGSSLIPVIEGITTAMSAIGGIISGFGEAAASAAKAQKELLERQQELFQGELDYNALIRQRALMVAELNEGTLQSIKAKERELELQLNINGALDKARTLGEASRDTTSAQEDAIRSINNLLKTGEQITGTHTETSGALWWKKSKTVQDTASLQGIITSNWLKRLEPIIGNVPEQKGGETLAGRVKDYEAALEVMKQLDKLATNHKLTEETQKQYEALQKQIGTVDDLTKQYEQLKETAAEIFSGTTSEAIADSIIDGFKAGKRSIEDFADDFEKIIGNSILSTIKDSLLNGTVKDVWAKFKEFASQDDGMITETQRDQLRQMYESAIQDASKQFDQAKEIFGDNIFGDSQSSGSSLTGQIKGITQETASELAGLFRNSLSIDKGMLSEIKLSNNYLMQNMNSLKGIEINTGNTVIELKNAVKELKGIKQGTDKITKGSDLRGAGLAL